MWCSDWAEILYGNVSWLDEHTPKISRNLHVRLGRCFRTAGASWGRRGRVVHVSWAFGTVGEDFSRTQGDWLVRFIKILYGGSWGGMRSPHKISAQLEVIWQVNLRFEKTATVWRLPAEFYLGMAIDGVL